MKSSPKVMEHFSTVHAFFVINLARTYVVKYNVRWIK